MTPAARFQAVIEILEQVSTLPKPADALVSAYFRARRYIGSKDRGFISETTYEILRHHARLRWWIDKLGFEVTARLRLIAYESLVSGSKPKQIAEIFEGGKFAPSPLLEDEKKAIGLLANHTLDHPEMPEASRLECPSWAEEGLRRRFGKSFAKEMGALLSSAPLDLRINPLKTTREEALTALVDGGVPANPCSLSPWGLRVDKRVNLSTLPLLKTGALEIQDEGSQLVAYMLDAKEGERVVDFCAGAGGKTLAISACMNNKGRIVACDVLAGRLKRSAERFRRAGLSNIETRPLASETDPWVKKHKESFDRVLVDAPCSGTGTWRRNPDARWKNLGPGLAALLPLQASILSSAARLVKKGGRLVYATCSMLPEENEKQIEAFLKDNPDFRLLPAFEAAPSLSLGKMDYLSLSPAKDGTDGFFAAAMVRA
jgi:16S rRNA (cytosine967-C5)-methyltransferase